MSRRFIGATALISSVFLLAACTGTTPGGSSDSSNANGNGAATSQAAAPKVTLVDSKGKSLKTVPAGSKVYLKAENGSFSSVELTDDEHSSIPADTGTVESDDSTTGDSTSSAPATTGSAQNSAFQAAGSTSSQTGSDLESNQTATADASSTSSDSQAAAQGTDWSSKYTVAGSSSYTWKASVVDSGGKTQRLSGSVDSGKATSETTRAVTEISDGDTVGVAAPIGFNFSGIVPKSVRASIENRMSVEVTDKSGNARNVDGSWGWLPDDDGHSTLHYRTKEHWPAYSKVEVNAPLKGVRTSDDTFGAKNVTLDFTVGRSQIVKASAKTHRMVVTRDGKQIWDWPASLGRPTAPSYNGEHIVMSKAANYTMRSTRWNYVTPVKWAVRIHNNGEFVHAAPWSEGSQGSANVSHGCINLATDLAAKYFKTAIYGDPVTITGSSVSLTPSSGDVSDWTYSWKQWQDLSAIR